MREDLRSEMASTSAVIEATIGEIMLEDFIQKRLEDGPKSSRELEIPPEQLRLLAEKGLVVIDPDRWPDEYVPGNPMVVRLPGDERPWPGWKEWNL